MPLNWAFRFPIPRRDGPTIQRSSERALKIRISLPAIFRLVRDFRRTSELPIILFGYYNPFFRFGLDKFATQAAQAGADGVLCVDLPPEESGELKSCTDRRDLDVIFLLSPTSGEDRRRLVARHGRGFIYYVAVTGVTGARQSFDRDLRSAGCSGAQGDGIAGGRRFRHLDATASGLDRRVCRCCRGRQRPGATHRARQTQS